MTRTLSPSPSRRSVLAATGTLAATGLALTATRPAFASAADVDARLAELIGKTKPTPGKVKVEGPEIAENGNTVPVGVEVDAPMTAQLYVKDLHVLAEGNPVPSVASFHFTPASGKAYAKFRIRLAQTQKIRAVAVMSDGTAFSGEKEIKVTIGGCGG